MLRSTGKSKSSNQFSLKSLHVTQQQSTRAKTPMITITITITTTKINNKTTMTTATDATTITRTKRTNLLATPATQQHCTTAAAKMRQENYRTTCNKNIDFYKGCVVILLDLCLHLIHNKKSCILSTHSFVYCQVTVLLLYPVFYMVDKMF